MQWLLPSLISFSNDARRIWRFVMPRGEKPSWNNRDENLSKKPLPYLNCLQLDIGSWMQSVQSLHKAAYGYVPLKPFFYYAYKHKQNIKLQKILILNQHFLKKLFCLVIKWSMYLNCFTSVHSSCGGSNGLYGLPI